MIVVLVLGTGSPELLPQGGKNVVVARAPRRGEGCPVVLVVVLGLFFLSLDRYLAIGNNDRGRQNRLVGLGCYISNAED